MAEKETLDVVSRIYDYHFKGHHRVIHFLEKQYTNFQLTGIESFTKGERTGNVIIIHEQHFHLFEFDISESSDEISVDVTSRLIPIRELSDISVQYQNIGLSNKLYCSTLTLKSGEKITIQPTDNTLPSYIKQDRQNDLDKFLSELKTKFINQV